MLSQGKLIAACALRGCRTVWRFRTSCAAESGRGQGPPRARRIAQRTVPPLVPVLGSAFVLSRVSMKHFMIMLPCVGLGRSAPGRQHRHTISITAIIFAEEIDQISLFQEDANTDVGRGCSREQQMPDGHRGRHPEGDDEAEIGPGVEPAYRTRARGSACPDGSRPVKLSTT